tara:strand:+ start:2031 stop:2906 length:876 start_codon:yes stop_codon:yes gene_type:complete
MKSPFWVNEVYSLGFWLKKYSFYPSKLPLCNYLDHGVSLSDKIHKHEIKNNAPVIFKYSPFSVLNYKKVSQKPVYCVINPLIFYRKKNIIKNQNSNGTLFFPAHSTDLIEDKINWGKLIIDLKSIPAEFQPVEICLHHNDFEKNIGKKFELEGFKVHTAGKVDCNYFAESFYSLINKFKFTMSNDIGTYTFYSVEMGIPFSLYGLKPNYFNNGDPNFEKGNKINHTKDKRRKKAENLFNGFHNHISADQREFVEIETGVKDSIGRFRACVILYYALISYYLRVILKKQLFK